MTKKNILHEGGVQLVNTMKKKSSTGIRWNISIMWLGISFLLLTAGCSCFKSDRNTQMSMEQNKMEQNRKVALGLLEALNKGDANGAVDLLAEDATWWVLGNIPRVSGTFNKQETAENFRKMFASLGGRQNFTVNHVIAEGDYVAIEAQTEVKTPKGKIYQNNYHFKFEIKDGKILRVRAYLDTALRKEMMSDE